MKIKDDNNMRNLKVVVARDMEDEKKEYNLLSSRMNQND